MSVYSGPDVAIIRHRLKHLVRNGVDPEWILDVGDELLELRVVVDGLPSDYDEDNQADASADPLVQLVVKLLREAIDGVPSRRVRVLLRTVLGLRPEMLALSATRRRTEAGRMWSKAGVSGETIRSHHEPRALDRLAVRIAIIEAAHRGEDPPDTSSLARQTRV